MNVGRRDVLRGLVLLTVAAGTAAGAAGCTETPEDAPPDPLAELAARARADATTAQAVKSAVPALAEAAGVVAEARGEHARALRAEVERARPPVSSSSAAPPEGEQPPADAGAARTLLLDALTAAERQAAELVASLPRHRAGLVGSVAAGCASLREVLA
ncbi:hypothetical protein [Actinophytocola gossypii]|uniref:Uncharacterized protein n=1 Tax=Actinophytocola gossypii TaxID=2812003 RepID=A0ABT2J9Y9_9PSEU|nr:hypothetical protein [Actinophytocola gossypii]MCT2584660.1 hypothetical protein [Actinophytocola gossypii]